MLKKRIITALVLIPLVLALLFFLPQVGFLYASAALMLLAAWEWTNLMQIKQRGWRVAYLILLVYAGFATLFMPVMVLFSITMLWWCLAFLMVVRYPKGAQCWSKGDLGRGLMGLFVLVPCWGALNYIRSEADGVYVLLYLLVLIWGADTAAYFAGKKWGKRKLAPEVSPGKSIEGFTAALVFGACYSLLIFWLDAMPPETWILGMGLSVVTVALSVLGDLTESMLKRQVGLKDSGQLLPGHGGLLDRIDSLTAAAPCFAFGAILIAMLLN